MNKVRNIVIACLFLAVGLMWPMLRFGMTAARIAFWFLVYSALATIAGFVLAALWGAGSSIMPNGIKRRLAGAVMRRRGR